MHAIASQTFISYCIVSFEDITPRESNTKVFELEAEIVPTEKLGSPEEASATTKTAVKVTCARTLQAMWITRKSELGRHKNLRRVLYEYGKRYLEEKLQAGKTTGRLQLALHLKNAPELCPFDPANIEIGHNIWYEVKVNNPKPPRSGRPFPEPK